MQKKTCMSNLPKLQTTNGPRQQRDGWCPAALRGRGAPPGLFAILTEVFIPLPLFTVVHYLLSFSFSFKFLKGLPDVVLNCQGINATDIGKGKLNLKTAQTTEAEGFMTLAAPLSFHSLLTEDKLNGNIEQIWFIFSYLRHSVWTSHLVSLCS